MSLMDLVDKVKNGSIVDKVKERVLPPAAPTRLTMRLCMLGARGVGKTSIITSMYNQQKKVLSGTSLFLSADPVGTAPQLDSKLMEIKDIFKGLHKEGELVKESGISPSFSESVFRFSYGLSSAKVNIDLEIRDYPGEFLRQEPETVGEFIRQADCVMIAVDTPCMMEADGRYHQGKNRPDQVTDFLKNYLSGEEDKLILFVPLKCEKYFRDNTIEDVTRKIQQEYQELIAFLKERGKKSTCCAITPIQTLGGVVFDSFDADEAGETEYETDDGRPLPARMNFRYTATNADYSPVYCEQPLFYLLAFVSKQYEKAQKSADRTVFLNKLKELLRLIPQVDDFMTEISLLGTRRMESGDGYKILFGRGRI